MIIKFKTKSNSWVVIDGISKIEYKYIPPDTQFYKFENGLDYLDLIEFEAVGPKDGPYMYKYKDVITEIQFKRNNDINEVLGHQLLINETAYLMNDDGKTIDTI